MRFWPALLLGAGFAVAAPLAGNAQCTSDLDCGDGDLCNGSEVCFAGRCWPGIAPACGIVGASDRGCAAGYYCNAFRGCVCQAPCNSNSDCGLAEKCGDSGRCEAARPCAADRDCPSGELCFARFVCGPAPPPPPPPFDCRVCKDDGDPCNGLVMCDGTSCFTTTPPACDDGNPATVDSCERVDAEHHRCVSRPDRCRQTRLRATRLRMAWGAKAGVPGRFELVTELQAPFGSSAELVPSRARFAVQLFDEQGRSLLAVPSPAAEAPAGSPEWKRDGGGWRWSAGGAESALRRIDLRPVPSKDGRFLLAAEGELDWRGAHLDLPSLRPTVTLAVDWAGDVGGPCGAVTLPLCATRRLGEETAVFCRQELVGGE